jgi:hypothetical protein
MLLLSQVKEPERPDIPEINNTIESGFIFKVKLTIHGKPSSMEGEMHLNTDVLITADKRIIRLKDISKINIIMWEKRSKINRHIFYPAQYEFFFRDYRKIIINGNIELLNRIKLSNKNTVYIYSYYYDYFKKEKWINSGSTGFDASVSRPAEGCIVTIELIL